MSELSPFSSSIHLAYDSLITLIPGNSGKLKLASDKEESETEPFAESHIQTDYSKTGPII